MIRCTEGSGCLGEGPGQWGEAGQASAPVTALPLARLGLPHHCHVRI